MIGMNNPYKAGDRVRIKAEHNDAQRRVEKALGRHPYYLVLKKPNDDIVNIGRPDGSEVRGDEQGWFYWRFELAPMVVVTLDDSLFEV
jgi:hypothetical protein